MEQRIEQGINHNIEYMESIRKGSQSNSIDC